MKLFGARLMLWSTIALIVGQLPSFLSEESMFALGPLVALLGWIGLLAWPGIIAGLIIYLVSRPKDGETLMLRSTRFWLGAALAMIGVGIPGFFIYEMLFVPGGADAIFIVMMLGPFCLAAVIGGIVLMVRNRK